MATLEDDVRSHAAYDLYELRRDILAEAANLTPTQLVDKAITCTVDSLEKQFRFETKGACESNGDPHYCTDISMYYWSIVNDTSGDV